MKLSYKTTYFLLKGFAWLLNISPNFIRNIFAGLLYFIMFYLIPIRKSVYLENLKIAFPKKDQQWYKSLAKNGYKFFMHRFVQFFAFPNSYHSANINIIGQDKLDDAFRDGRGVVFISGHFGAWELLSAWVTSNGYPVTGVAAKQKNHGSNRFFIEQRGQFGMKHVYRRSSIDDMYALLKDNEAIALVSDQDARKRGVFVDFMGRKASTPKGAARFYLYSGSSLIFTVCYQIKKHEFNVEFVPIKPKDNATIESITQTFTTLLEEYIRKYPEQYFWFHRRWKTKPEQ